jgi:hypothetical protein
VDGGGFIPFRLILSSPTYTYSLGFLANPTSVIPIFSASSTPELIGTLLLTRTGKPAMAALATITSDSLPLLIRAHPDRSTPVRRAAPTILSTELDLLFVLAEGPVSLHTEKNEDLLGFP